MTAFPEYPMTLPRMYCAFGNGDMGRGKHFCAMLAKRMEEAREKHPRFAKGSYEALEVIEAEFRELARAVALETPDRMLDKALDLATTVMRFAHREYLVKAKKERKKHD